MNSATLTFFVSSLCTLLFPYYVAGEIKIVSCNLEHLSPGSVKLEEINVGDKGIINSKLTLNSQLDMSTVSVQFDIKDENGDSMMSSNFDLCSMSSNDMFKPYFSSFDDSNFNEGECPIPAGTYTSGEVPISIDGSQEGHYECSFEAMTATSGPMFRVQCSVEVSE